MARIISVFELFTIGIGPSSSHTVGPMRAARRFAEEAAEKGLLSRIGRIKVELFGSLALTGIGHGTDRAVVLGLSGHRPESIDPEQVGAILTRIRDQGQILLPGKEALALAFDWDSDLVLHRDRSLPEHPNGMIFHAYLDRNQDAPVFSKVFYSIGGGFIRGEEASVEVGAESSGQVPYPFYTAKELLALCEAHSLRISDVMLENEKAYRDAKSIERGLIDIWNTMQACVQRGCRKEGTLPGRLSVRRRAALIHQELVARPENSLRDPLTILDWVNLYALAVNEENAAGGRVVTAPTNGAAGIVPAVLHYYDRFCPARTQDGVARFLLTAGAIGILFKLNASISGAEVGCQGEVGVACSMAAAALTEVLGGSVKQVENAAEIAMEHNLGLTCDPVDGLVQIPCIERNAMGAIKAINASRIALRGDGTHSISLDQVMKTMRETGKDMSAKYKETSEGGLAVNRTEC